MPRFNASGQWCAGVGRGIVSRQDGAGHVVIATDAGDAQWYAGRVAYQRETDRAFLEAEGGELLSDKGANRFRSGGERWGAWLDNPRGYRDSTGREEANWNVADVGPDGTIAVILDYPSGKGLRLLHPDGRVLDVPDARPDDQTVHVLGWGQAIWTEQGHQAFQSIGFPLGIQLLTHVGFWLRGVVMAGDIWLLYQDERDRLVFHHSQSSRGFVVAQGATFRPDVNADAIVWATHEGERPEDIVVRRLSDLPPKSVDLRPTAPAEPVDPPIPPVEPPKEPTVPEFPFPAGYDPLPKLEAVRAKFRTPIMVEGQYDDRPRFLIDSCEAVGHGAGLLKKDGGTYTTLPNGVKVSQDWMEFPNGSATDFVLDGENTARVAWGAAQPSQGTRVDVSSMFGGVADPPGDPGGGDPGPGPDTDLARLIAELRDQFNAFGGRLSAVERVGDANAAQLLVSGKREANFETRIAVLEKGGTGTGCGVPIPADLAKQIAAELLKLFGKMAA